MEKKQADTFPTSLDHSQRPITGTQPKHELNWSGDQLRTYLATTAGHETEDGDDKTL